MPVITETLTSKPVLSNTLARHRCTKASVGCDAARAKGLELIVDVDESVPDLHEMNRTPSTPLAHLPYDKLCPGAAVLDKLQAEYR